ncbi:MAG: hypothetical protein ACREV5_16095 [Steroidobacter sp.]
MSKPYRKSLLSLLLPRLGGSPPRQEASPSTPMFQAVSIHRGSKACDLARQFGQHRFLAKKSPALPLPGCAMREQCQCRYIKHRDRRTDSRRLMDMGISTMVFDARERRFRKGRRATD